MEAAIVNGHGVPLDQLTIFHNCSGSTMTANPQRPSSRPTRHTGLASTPMFMPDVAPDQVARVVNRGLAHAAECGFDEVDLEVDRADDVLRAVLLDHGFTIKEEGVVEAWLSADARLQISPIGGTTGCRLAPTRPMVRTT